MDSCGMDHWLSHPSYNQFIHIKGNPMTEQEKIYEAFRQASMIADSLEANGNYDCLLYTSPSPRDS